MAFARFTVGKAWHKCDAGRSGARGVSPVRFCLSTEPLCVSRSRLEWELLNGVEPADRSGVGLADEA
eukprot:5917217-Prymnesium_polylepis.2